MEKVSFYESIVRILELTSSVPFLLEVLLLTAFLMIVMIIFYFTKSKKGKSVTIVIYIITLLLLPISHIDFFANLFDKLVENFVKIVFFPSWFIYLIMLFVTNISILKKFIKVITSGKSKWIYVFDIAYFFIFQFLFFLIVYICSKNSVDIFDSTQLYSNSILLSLIQVSSYLFWIRCGIIIISAIINILSGEVPIQKIESKPKVIRRTNKTNNKYQNVNGDGNNKFITNNNYKTVDTSNKQSKSDYSINNDVIPKNYENSKKIDSKKQVNLDLNSDKTESKKFFDDFYD